ncbi:MAG: cadherin repeat domain-containing protein [Candidatus Thiodiazotropha sp.]
MGIHGNHGSTATATRSIESEGRGPDIAINEAGNITSGGARVSDGVAFAHDSKMEVYDNAGNYLGSSDVLENGVDATLGDVTFTFSTPIPVDNETVRAYVWGDNLGSGLNLAYDGGSGRNFQGLATYPTPPDPDGSGTDGRYYAVWVTVTPTASRSADSLTGAFRRGNTGVTVNCTGLDIAPTTQTVTVTDGTHSDTCTITNWNSGDPIINIDCALPPGAYDIQVTDDTGTVTLSGQTLLIETNWEEVVFDGNTPPANQESLSEGSLEDFPAIPEIVAGDSWGVQSHADVTWQANGSVIILPAGEHTLSYWFWDDSTGVMYSGETIVIGERPDLTSPTLTSTGQNTMQGTVDTDTDTGTLYAYWSTSATPPSATDLKAGTGAAWSGNQTVTSTGTKTFNATGLVAGTTYYAHFLHDNSGSESAISTSAGVATYTGGGNQAPVINDQTFYVTLAPGVELVANGTFDTDLNGWTNTASHWSAVGGRAYHSLNANFNNLNQTIVLDTNYVYKVEFDYETVTDELKSSWRTSAGIYVYNWLTDVSGTGTHSSYELIPDGAGMISFARSNAGVQAEFYIDNVSVVPVCSKVIGTVSASDPDLDTLTYSIIAGNTDNDLTIDPNTGVLSWVNVHDINRTASYALTIQVDDGTATASATITINVIDVPEGTNAKLSLSLELGVE